MVMTSREQTVEKELNDPLLSDNLPKCCKMLSEDLPEMLSPARRGLAAAAWLARFQSDAIPRKREQRPWWEDTSSMIKLP